MRVGAATGLQLNTGKSEIICACPATRNSILPSLPGAKVVNPNEATLLGSSIGDTASITDILRSKITMLKRMGDRLQHLSAHDAILLLKHSFALPKLLYNLRTAPCFLSPALQEYNGLLKSILSGITNIHFEEDSPTWLQATLPVKMGGIGIQSAVQLAACTFCVFNFRCCLLHLGPPHHTTCAPVLPDPQLGRRHGRLVRRSQ